MALLVVPGVPPVQGARAVTPVTRLTIPPRSTQIDGSRGYVRLGQGCGSTCSRRLLDEVVPPRRNAEGRERGNHISRGTAERVVLHAEPVCRTGDRGSGRIEKLDKVVRVDRAAVSSSAVDLGDDQVVDLSGGGGGKGENSDQGRDETEGLLQELH